MGIFAGKTPSGSTPLAQALQAAFKMGGASDKKDLYIVLLDGEPDNEKAVYDVLIAQANTLQKDNDCTVLFIQIGDDADASAFLQDLDDGLTKRGAKFDIVDTKKASEVAQFGSFEELLANAIVD
jgi:hypothetical protein